MNNNIIPACVIGAGLFAVALKPAPQPASIPQAEPVAVATASVTGPSEPVIVWYGTGVSRLYRAWSDGTIEAKRVENNLYRVDCPIFLPIRAVQLLHLTGSSSPPPKWHAAPTSTATGEIEFDLLAVLNQWGDQLNLPRRGSAPMRAWLAEWVRQSLLRAPRFLD